MHHIRIFLKFVFKWHFLLCALLFIHIFYNLIKKHSILQKEIPHSSSFVGFIRNDRSFLMEGEEVKVKTYHKDRLQHPNSKINPP
jgi:hypothetical protein